MKRMGIKNAKPKSQEEINSFASNYIDYPGIHLEQKDNYYEFFSRKDSLIKHKDSTALDSFKVFIQPLQALYFDSTGNLESLLINCFAGQVGYNLDWNTNNRLDFFPPTTHTRVFGKITLREILELTNLKKDSFQTKNTAYTVLVFWNIFLNKQTVQFLKAIQNNFKNSKDSITVYYINNDNSFYKNL